MSATPSKTKDRWAVFCDRAPQVAVIGIAFSGSVTNILTLCAEHGVRGLEAWSVASVIDLTAMIAAYERQRDKALNRPRKGWMSFPTLLLVGDIGLSLAMQLAIAHPGAWGHVIAIVALVAMLMIVFMLERRAAHEERMRRAAVESATEASSDSGAGTGNPAAIPVSATGPDSGTGYLVPAPAATGSPVPAPPPPTATAPPPARPAALCPPAAPRAPRSEPPYRGPRSVDHLLADARRLSADYRAANGGNPIPLKDMRAGLACNNGLASQIRNQVLTEEEKVA